VKTQELAKTVEELEERLKSDTSPTSQTDDEGLRALLGKSLDLLGRWLPREEINDEKVKKSEGEDEEEAPAEPTAQEKLEKSEKTGQEATYKSLVDSKVGDTLDEMVDATPVLAEVIDVVAKSQGQVNAIYESLASQDEKIDALVQANAALCKGFEALYTSVLSQPRRPTSPGFVMTPSNEKSTPTGTDLKSRLWKAVQDGKCEPYVISWLDTRSEEDIIAALPPGALD
jgi:hypothetical protein